MKKALLYCIILLLFISCNKDDDEQSFAPEPVISIVNVTPKEMIEFDNKVQLTLSYEDVNGDIGYDDPDVFAIHVKDSRLDSADWYHIPPLAPIGHNILIKGELTIELNKFFILGNGNQEVAALSIKIRDREGHWSNEVTTPNLVILK